MEKYENLEMEVIEFDSKDVVTASTGEGDITGPEIDG
jgi:hypothetical protein